MVYTKVALLCVIHESSRIRDFNLIFSHSDVTLPSKAKGPEPRFVRLTNRIEVLTDTTNNTQRYEGVKDIYNRRLMISNVTCASLERGALAVVTIVTIKRASAAM